MFSLAPIDFHFISQAFFHSRLLLIFMSMMWEGGRGSGKRNLIANVDKKMKKKRTKIYREIKIVSLFFAATMFAFFRHRRLLAAGT
jgi:hypothetical protein